MISKRELDNGLKMRFITERLGPRLFKGTQIGAKEPKSKKIPATRSFSPSVSSYFSMEKSDERTKRIMNENEKNERRSI